MTYRELKAYKSTGGEQRCEIEAFIAAVPDPQTREMFRLRFMCGMKYLRIAMQIGGGMTASCVKMRIARYMDSLYKKTDR